MTLDVWKKGGNPLASKIHILPIRNRILLHRLQETKWFSDWQDHKVKWIHLIYINNLWNRMRKLFRQRSGIPWRHWPGRGDLYGTWYTLSMITYTCAYVTAIYNIYFFPTNKVAYVVKMSQDSLVEERILIDDFYPGNAWTNINSHVIGALKS